jgi:hypothetical protein
LLAVGSAGLLSSVDVFGVWETRNHPAVKQHLHTHNVFCTPVDSATRNVAGTGGAIGISKSLSSHIRFVGWHPHIPLGWVQIHNTFIGFVYFRPALLNTAQERVDFMVHLHSDVALKQRNGGVILMGDFNANLGSVRDASPLPRACMGQACVLGSSIMDMACRCDLATTTGRMDSNEHTFKQGDTLSRIDHVFVQLDIWHHVLECNPLPEFWGSDHRPLRLLLSTADSAPVPRSPPRSAPFLRWSFQKQSAYIHHLLAQTHLWRQLRAALSDRDASLASNLIISLIWVAASAAGMVVDPMRHRAPAYAYLSLPPEAASTKSRIRKFTSLGLPVPTELRIAWRQIVRDARRRRDASRHAALTTFIWQRPRMFWKQFKTKTSPPVAVLSDEVWRGHYACMFAGEAPGISHDHRADAHPLRDDLQCLVDDITPQDVANVWKCSNTAKACGVDGIPSEFVSRARVQLPDGSWSYCLADIFSHLFTIVLQSCNMPLCWKAKCIYPIHKKGPITDPANYRPIAVSTSFYVMFAAVLAKRLAPFCAPGPQSLLAPMQFAFRRDMGVEQAQLPILTARDMCAARGDPLVLVKLDIRKAYDTVVRELLWVTLLQAGFPTAFVCMLQNMYSDAQYVVAANGGFTKPFVSTKGLLQGCPLSPILYSIFLKPALIKLHAQTAHLGFQFGAVLSSFVNFADDLTGLFSCIAFVPRFVRTAECVLGEVHQFVNVDKTQILVMLQAVGPLISQLPPNLAACVVAVMKVLGVTYNADGSLTTNIDHRISKGRSKVALAVARMRALGCLTDLRINLLLLNADVRPTLLFASCIWGFEGLRVDPMQHSMQPAFTTLMRTALQLPGGTSNWAAVCMTGQMPVQHWIIRDFFRFYNRLLVLARANPLVQGCVYVQATLALHNVNCWLGKWVASLARILPQLPFLHDISQMQPVLVEHQGGVIDMLCESYISLFRSFGEPFSMQPVRHRRIALHVHIFWSGRWGVRPWWHCCSVAAREWRCWVRFLACQAPVPAQTQVGIIPYNERLCMKCGQGVVANEQHVLLECTCTAVVRAGFYGTLVWPWNDSLRLFLLLNRNVACIRYVSAALRTYSSCDPLRGDIA